MKENPFFVPSEKERQKKKNQSFAKQKKKEEIIVTTASLRERKKSIVLNCEIEIHFDSNRMLNSLEYISFINSTS